MKNGFALLLFVIASGFVSVSSAENIIQKPDIPADYTEWQTIQKASCVVKGTEVTTSFFGKIQEGKVNIVSTLSTEQETAFIVYAIGTREDVEMWIEYYPTSSGWIRLQINVDADDKAESARLFIATIQRILNIDNSVGAAVVFEGLGCKDPANLDSFVNSMYENEK